MRETLLRNRHLAVNPQGRVPDQTLTDPVWNGEAGDNDEMEEMIWQSVTDVDHQSDQLRNRADQEARCTR